ncbi:hypothetical protein SLEP1_g53558 [Rubroshorea leprosula]|uniref:Uncharacterized protein n=1 Tax=Rubroshorea leprosula TaxID=152421 RepID=A0AAV5MCK2_9ROSI|nr:hypothetical protein SLEP1_g53558 [Rubroshorea leprosula]
MSLQSPRSSSGLYDLSEGFVRHYAVLPGVQGPSPEWGFSAFLMFVPELVALFAQL